MNNLLGVIRKKRGPQEWKVQAEADAKVIKRCQGGDLKAFEELVRKYMPTAMGVSMGYLRNMDEAVDLSQDAFVRALEALPSFDVSKPFFPWFYVLLKNACLNRLRRIRHQKEISLEDLGENHEPTARENRSSKDPSNAVRSAVSRLSPEHKEVILLRHWQDLSYEQIAEATGLQIGTVMSRLHYARKELREMLSGAEVS